MPEPDSPPRLLVATFDEMEEARRSAKVLRDAERTALRDEYESRAPALEAHARQIEESIEKALEDAGHAANVSARLKEWSSVWRKWEARAFESLIKVPDLVGVRVIVLDVADLDRVREIIEARSLSPVGFVAPKLFRWFDDHGRASGYESIHYYGRLRHQPDQPLPFFEIQIRTLLQHVWSELSHDSFYKGTGIPAEVQVRALRLAAGLSIMQDELETVRANLNAAREGITESMRPGRDLYLVKLDEASLVLTAKREIEYMDWLCRAGLASGFHTSVWEEPARPGDETEIALRVCGKIGIGSVGGFIEVVDQIRQHEHDTLVLLRALQAAVAERTGLALLFDRPLLVFSCLVLLAAPRHVDSSGFALDVNEALKSVVSSMPEECDLLARSFDLNKFQMVRVREGVSHGA